MDLWLRTKLCRWFSISDLSGFPWIWTERNQSGEETQSILGTLKNLYPRDPDDSADLKPGGERVLFAVACVQWRCMGSYWCEQDLVEHVRLGPNRENISVV